MATKLFDRGDEQEPPTHAALLPPHRRRYGHGSDKLLTIDRAMLTGIFLAGAWYATTDLRAGNVNERLQQVEKRQERIVEQRGEEAIRQAGEVATIKQQLKEIDRRTESIERNLGELATSTARLANAVREPQR